MVTVRPSRDRGHADEGWFDSRHSFSFGGYQDPAHTHWGPLRVINEDRVAPGRGLETQYQQDMEIISYVLEGALGHRDSLGTASSIEPGDVQRMSAGKGVQQSEANPDTSGAAHFLQIWIAPDQQGAPPSYSQKHFPDAEKRGKLRLVVSGDGAQGSVSIRQDARLYAGLLEGDEQAALPLASGRLGYVHVARGAVVANGHALKAGDALLLQDEPSVRLETGRHAEVLVFDLPQA
ncbi:pirin family protein [Pseudoxanthomonas sp.]|uniref:pirin family protein n=1 Tax=Pseudoxanthomonas sp. TaxID=1871049 RepID=UPI0026092201|nr:pirin family protein [Pseudoxanthomonas sp.]WDS38034.1 MAG: pirin family protein [Pseudoxanthomonas sp.]